MSLKNPLDYMFEANNTSNYDIDWVEHKSTTGKSQNYTINSN